MAQILNSIWDNLEPLSDLELDDIYQHNPLTFAVTNHETILPVEDIVCPRRDLPIDSPRDSPTIQNRQYLMNFRKCGDVRRSPQRVDDPIQIMLNVRANHQMKTYGIQRQGTVINKKISKKNIKKSPKFNKKNK